MVTSRHPQHSAALHPSPDGYKPSTRELREQRQHAALLLMVTIEPAHPLQLLSERGPGAEYQSRLVEEYTERRSDPQRGAAVPESRKGNTLLACMCAHSLYRTTFSFAVIKYLVVLLLVL